MMVQELFPPMAFSRSCNTTCLQYIHVCCTHSAPAAAGTYLATCRYPAGLDQITYLTAPAQVRLQCRPICTFDLVVLNNSQPLLLLLLVPVAITCSYHIMHVQNLVPMFVYLKIFSLVGVGEWGCYYLHA